MKRLFGFLTTVLFLSGLPGSGLAQSVAGIPPMLETQRPLAMPDSQPQPQPPRVDYSPPVASPAKAEKTKKASAKKTNAGKAKLADQKKPSKAVKKKGETAKPRGKSAAKTS